MAIMSILSVLSVCLISIQIAFAQQPLYAQCGGIGWTGGMVSVDSYTSQQVCLNLWSFVQTCTSGVNCTKLNDCM
jgi:cytochrome c oxidase assembly protein Cox11